MSAGEESGAMAAGGAAPILIVDDDQAIRELLCWALTDEGLPVAQAADGRQAIALLAARRPALLLLDITLPLADGAQVADELHARYGGAVPIVAMTADGRAAEKARRVGALAYFHKPFTLDDLLAAVQQALRHTGG